MGAVPEHPEATPRMGAPSSGDGPSERALVEQRAVEAEHLKSELLANSSHALRSPLNVIIGFAELLQSGKVGALAPEHQEFVGDIVKSGRHLLQLVNDLLDLATVEWRELDLRLEDVDVHQLLQDVRDVVRGLAASKRIRLEHTVEDGFGSVFVDPRRVKQILYSFVATAIRLTATGGRVFVRARGEGSELFRLEVEYTGSRLTSDMPPRPELGPDEPGVGSPSRRFDVEVALASWLAEAHGGRVEVTREPGRGGVCAAILPRRAPPPGAGR